MVYILNLAALKLNVLEISTVVDVDIDVQDPLVVLEELQDGQDDVIDIAETRGLAFLGVVEAARPVDGDVCRLLVELDGRGDRPAGRQLAELVEAVEDGTVLADVEPLHLLVVLPHVVRPDRPEEPDVVVAVELGHLLLSRLVRSVDLHLPVETIVEQQVVGHPYPVGLHRVALTIVVVADVTWWQRVNYKSKLCIVTLGAPSIGTC